MQMPTRNNIARRVGSAALCILLASCGSAPPPPAPEADILQAPLDGKIQIVWSRAVGSMNPFLQPARYDDTLCTVSARGESHHIRIDGRIRKPSFNLPYISDEYTGGAGCSDAAVAAITEDGRLVVTDNKGQVKWQRELKSRVVGAPIIVGRRILTLTLDARISAWTLDRGKPLWSYISPLAKILRTSVDSSIWVNDRVVYAGLNDSVIVALNLADGGMLWENTIYLPRESNQIADIQDVTTPVGSGNLICAGAYQSGVACFDARRGDKLWDSPMSIITRVDMDSRGSRLFATDTGGALHAFDAYSGETLWTVQTPYVLSSPAYIKGAVLVGDERGTLHAFTPDRGERITFLNIASAPLTYLRRLPEDDETAIALSQSGDLVRLQLNFN